jgi:hypothetical protein
MFEHIPGEDGLCVWPNCNQPVSESDYTCALEASERYMDSFGSNLIELDALRLRLQDAESCKVLAKKIESRALLQKNAPFTPPDPPEVPPPLKKNRRGRKQKKKSNGLVKPISANPSCNNNIADLHFFSPFKPQFPMDLIKHVVVAPKLTETDSMSLFPPVDCFHHQDLGPSSCPPTLLPEPDPLPDPHLHPHPIPQDHGPSSFMPTPLSGPDPLPDPHLHTHPIPHPHSHIHQHPPILFSSSDSDSDDSELYNYMYFAGH